MYSQYNEERILMNYFGNKNDGVVVDIGAADGFRFSNSYWLISKGWKALLIEPNNKNFEKLSRIHKNKNNVVLVNEAASSKTEDESVIYCDMNDNHEQLSTLSSKQMDNCKNYFHCDFYEQSVKVTKTSEIFNNNNIQHIDFLSIDTETLDYDVLKGIDFSSITIDLICVEHNNKDIEELMKKEGYSFYDKTVGNIFYKKENINE